MALPSRAYELSTSPESWPVRTARRSSSIWVPTSSRSNRRAETCPVRRFPPRRDLGLLRTAKCRQAKSQYRPQRAGIGRGFRRNGHRQSGGEALVAGAVGRHRREAQELLPLKIARRLDGAAGKELDAEGGDGRAVQHPADSDRIAGPGGRFQYRIVLQVVRPGVEIAGVGRSRAEGTGAIPRSPLE